MKSRILVCITAGVLTGPLAAQAQEVSLDLGTSSQNYTMFGLGDVAAYGPGYSSWSIQQGACVTGGGNTTCTLSGLYTSTSSALASGTYSFVTEFPGSGPTATRAGPDAPIGLSHPAFSNDIVYGNGANGGPVGLSPGTDMTLTLYTSAGKYIEPMVLNGAFVSGTEFASLFANATCSGVAAPTCSVYAVGQVPGAIISGPVNLSVEFELGEVTPPPTTGVPEPGALALFGLGFAGAGIMRRRKGCPTKLVQACR
jgi:hypothetical protein